MFQKLLSQIARELRKSRIPYMVIGGQAVLLYGEPRLTKDIDITLGAGPDHLGKVISLARKLKLKILADDTADFVKKTMVLPLIEEKSGIRIDLIFSHSPYERQAIERARPVKLGPQRTDVVKFAALEDVIVHKVIAGRARDIEDVKSILLKNPGYDRRYIAAWLKEFDASLGMNFLAVFESIEKELR